MSDLATMKECRSCKLPKDRSEFYKRAAMKDGLTAQCKECRAKDRAVWGEENHENRLEYMREHRRKNIDKYRAYETSPGIKESHKRAMKKYNEKNPLVRKAHKILRRAIRSGKIIKPDVCSSCPSTIGIQGHHEDYTKPLDVEWVCDECHKKIHVRHRAFIRALESSEL